MNKFKFTFDIDANLNIKKTLNDNLRQFNESKIGPYNLKPFLLYIVDETEQTIGGLKGKIFDKVCMVQTVWIHDAYRKQGLGKQLFEKLEQFAKESKCTIIQVEPSDFQAKDFYHKLGFSVVAILPGNFKGHTTYIMRKSLAADVTIIADATNDDVF